MKSFKNRRGIATVLGVLIFVGILFTAVIPLFMYVNDSNLNLYQTRMELQKIDEDKERESIDVYAYPPDPNEPNIILCIKNTSPMDVRMIRVWANDESYDVDFTTQSMMYNTSDPLNVSSALPEEGTGAIYVKVTTSRGNIIANKLNPLFYTAGSGWGNSDKWIIAIIISKEHPGAKTFQINVTDNKDDSVIFDDEIRMVGPAGSHIQTVYLPDIGSFHVCVTQIKVGIITQEDVLITTEEPWAWIYSTAV
jgi:hypothetical protein